MVQFLPHGYCMNWRPSLIWLHVISDALIVLAYASIPFLLLSVVRKRKDISFSWMLLAFGAFILACGGTHLMSIVTLWKPWYFGEGLLKLATAIASITTAILLWRLLPALLKMPSAGQLHEAHEALAVSHAELERRAAELAASYADLQKTSEARQRSEVQFQQLADSMPHMVWAAAPDGRVDYHNEPWFKFTGFNRDLTGDQSWEPVLHPDDITRCGEEWYASVRSGATFRTECRIKESSSGHYRWHMCQAVAAKNHDAQIERWYGAIIDIDDYKRVQIEVLNLNTALESRVAERTLELTRRNEELRRTQSWLQGILHSATDVSILAIDNEGIITFFNSGSERLLGYRAEELVGKCTPSIIFPPERCALQEHECDESFVFETAYLHRDGTPIDVSVAVSPMMDTNGERLGKLAIAVDTRTRRALEKQLTENNLRLQEQTRHAEEANRAKSDFLSAMSHEIRTPMNAILGMADLLWESELSETQRKYVNVFRRASANLLSLVNDILDLSKIESGRFELERVDFDLNEVVQLTVDMIRPKAETKNLKMTASIAPDTPQCLTGDPARLQQILANLLGNSTKFTETGTIHLAIHATDVAGRLHFAVSDTGVGIPADKLETIFRDFEQAESSTTRRFGGTGLGLGICRRLVQRMGGELKVTSELGKGSCFYFDAIFGLPSKEPLPRAENIPGNQSKALSLDTTEYAIQPVGRPDLLRLVSKLLATPQDAKDEERVEEQHMPIANGHKLRILIVDDSEDNQFLMQEYLKSEPFTITFAEDGKTGVGLAKTRNFDLILMDAQMPIMDGLTATKMIRASEKEAGLTPVPVLALTASAGQEDIQLSRAAGSNAHISKPVSKEELVRTIRRYAGDHSQPEKQDTVALTIPSGLEEAAKRYILSRTKEIPVLQGLLADNNFERIRVLAHNIAGTGRSYGFSDLTDLGRTVETSAREQNAERLAEQLAALSDYVKKAEQAILSLQLVASEQH